MVYSCHTGHLWVADKKGCIHILKSDDFSEVGTFAKHTQAVNVMTVSKDGKQIASGDSYRYTYVCDAESMLDTAHYAFHPASILDLSFSDDGNHLATVATDMSFALIDLQAKTHKQVKNPHFDKKPRTCMVMPDGKVATSGEDCAIRIWNLE
jgi:WD40 repeat protein